MSEETHEAIGKDDMEYYRQVIIRNLLRVRASKKMTQSQVAQFLGITTSGYGDYERHRCPEASVLLALSYFYNIPVASFFTEYDDNGKPVVNEVIKGALPDHFAAIADGLQTLAGSVAKDAAGRIKDIEERLRSVELFIAIEFFPAPGHTTTPMCRHRGCAH